MALPKPPPPIEIPPDTKRTILAGFRKVVETLQGGGKFEPSVTHTEVLHDPDLLASFIAAFRANPDSYAGLIVGYDGRPVTDPDRPLVCNVSLAQIQQLMVKTCARHMFLQDEEEKTVTKTVTTTRYLIFKETQQVTSRVRNKDPRVLREILGYIAFDWQLPLLADYADLSLQQLSELGENLLAFRTPEAIREFEKFDYNAIRKAKKLLGPDFPTLLETRPAALAGALYWPKDMYQFFRGFMGKRLFEFMARDETLFMMVHTMDKAVMKIYGEVLAYVAKENLRELQRLNIDRIEVLLLAMKMTFGPKMEPLLSCPNFAREVLRRQVEGLVHMHQKKDLMADAHLVTWSALKPSVLEWLAKQPKAA